MNLFLPCRAITIALCILISLRNHLEGTIDSMIYLPDTIVDPSGSSCDGHVRFKTRDGRVNLQILDWRGAPMRGSSILEQNSVCFSTGDDAIIHTLDTQSGTVGFLFAGPSIKYVCSFDGGRRLPASAKKWITLLDIKIFRGRFVAASRVNPQCVVEPMNANDMLFMREILATEIAA